MKHYTEEERVIRPATEEDCVIFFGGPPPFRLRAWVGLVDGEILGFGGIAFPPRGTPTLYVNLKPEAHRYGVTLTKTAKKFMDMLRRMHVPIVLALIDLEDKRAIRWAEAFGFRYTGVETEDGGCFQCLLNSDTSMTTVEQRRFRKDHSQALLAS
jgi:hypothetical protein